MDFIRYVTRLLAFARNARFSSTSATAHNNNKVFSDHTMCAAYIMYETNYDHVQINH